MAKDEIHDNPFFVIWAQMNRHRCSIFITNAYLSFFSDY